MQLGTSPVQVLIVHRDEPEKCTRTVEAFRSQDVPVRITVLDNDSDPVALHVLGRQVDDLDVVSTGRNAGFGPAANVGLRRWLETETGDWVVVAPHDAIPAPDCLRRILQVGTEQTRAGLLSAEYGRGHDYKPVIDRYLGGYVESTLRGSGWEDAGFPHGTLLVARRATLLDIGLFDERYFAYCEEADLGMRAKRSGWAVGIVWGAVVSNPGMAEGRAAHYLKLRNTLLLVREHYGRYPAFMRCVIALVSLAIRAARQEGRVHALERRAERMAIADFLRGRYGPPPRSLSITSPVNSAA